MKIYLTGADAVSDLHQNGYTNDFQLFGNDLLWLQENIFIRLGEFAITECHKIIDAKNNMDRLIVFGIYATWHNVKGILVSHSNRNTGTTPPVLQKKMNELYLLTGS